MKQLLSICATMILLCASLPAQSRCPIERSRAISIKPDGFYHGRAGNRLKDFRLRGNFDSHGGKVDFYITDAEGYADFINHKKFKTYHAIEKATSGKFDLNLPQGNYDVIFLNRSSSESRVVEAEICFGAPEEK